MPSDAILSSEMSEIPEKPSVLSVLSSCSALNCLSEEQRSRLCVESFVAYAERGEMIWLAGSAIQFVTICGTGFIKMTRITPKGSEVAVELLGPGQCLGLIAAIEGRVYPLNATAVTKTWYLKVPSRAIKEVYQANERLRDMLLRSLAPRLRKAHEMMARMSSEKIEQRMAAVLLILLETYATDSDAGTLLSVPLTRQDLAEMAGTTVETAIRVMSKWQKQQLLSTNHQWITIRSIPALEDILTA